MKFTTASHVAVMPNSILMKVIPVNTSFKVSMIFLYNLSHAKS